ncbi:MAG: glycosyltransferase [Spirosomataceae bacterium]
MQITFHPHNPQSAVNPTFSILIPTWNNREFAKLCVASIQKNSRYTHQIILHINEGTDGTLDWAKEAGLDYTYSPENVGVCWACNAMFRLAKADYIVYMNDDMYVCPDWDYHLLQTAQEYPNEYVYLSATMIERVEWQSNRLAFGNFGTNPSDFQEESLLNKYKSLTLPDWQGGTSPPSLMHRRLWELVGGFSIEFTPGFGSDPDLSMKLWQAGVRHFRGVGASLVYHFMSKTTRKVLSNQSYAQFFRKWGLTIKVFEKQYLYGKNKYEGALSEQLPMMSDWQKWRYKLKYSIVKQK